ncbi:MULTISPECIES: ubiquinol-cytochrome c reductase iron-sulfur subunit N-terminal domain-containing protein [Streptomyces]|uniref:ubiquinol-cytochrome c reductase iron-sulfur subunit N-terminal domain-containing protein n=1 Tax=Streptomyces TaxID=1883 RepID=UPI001F17D76D|nr:ubiquinol-cytochrome c reductase iron-sulfur subunit N-terminal domain-containing protein [Streptomyces sp. AMCC400023]
MPGRRRHRRRQPDRCSSRRGISRGKPRRVSGGRPGRVSRESPEGTSPAPSRRTFIATTTTAVGAVVAGGLVPGPSVFGASPPTPSRRRPAAVAPRPSTASVAPSRSTTA